MGPQVNHFIVEFSEPYEHSNGQKYNRNVQLDVFTMNASRAMELVQEKHPEANFHVIRRVGTNAGFIVDPLIGWFQGDDNADR